MEQPNLYDLAISQIHGIGPRSVRNLISYCGTSKAVINAPKHQLMKIPGIGPEMVNKLKAKSLLIDAEKTRNLLAQYGVDFHFFTSTTYPARLKNFADSPAGFFYKGIHVFNKERTIAVVGTRTPSPQGCQMTEKVVEELAPYNPVIISGLAIGIDTIAHQSALRNNLHTIGILGQGFPDIYPPVNRKLGINMLSSGGLLSEFPFHKKADPRHFPQRNRIIAMLADALIVIESRKTGGSIISAHFANDYFKDVFAVPGRPGDLKSIGCNALIKSNRAALIDSGIDVALAMNWTQNKTFTNQQPSLFKELKPEEQKIFELLKEHNQVELDKLHYLSAIKLTELSNILLNLEFQGLIKVLPGKKYMIS